MSIQPNRLMRVARTQKDGSTKVEYDPIPAIGPGELLVEVAACGICGSDLLSWYVESKAPTVLGHEVAGTIAAVGEGIQGFSVGDRVFVHHHVPCFECHYCRRGRYTLCATFKETHIDPGGFSEFIRVPPLITKRDTLLLPPTVSFEAATFIEPLACAIQSIKRAKSQLGDSVAIIGVGQMGLILLQLVRLWGAGRVFATDLLEYRLDIARRMGADAIFNPKKGNLEKQIRQVNAGLLPDLVIVCTGSIAAYEQALQLVERGGTILAYSPTPPEASLIVPLNRLFFDELTISASYSASPLETRIALDLIASGRIVTEELITHRFGLEEVGKALDLASKATKSIKIVIIPSYNGST